ncbi:histidine kinase [Frateuria sp. Soil773]|uniref:sensor histidine kinase n=1 Tax=Frateuria sp. Soil773 TaxID=1736407 RepID=UPI0006FB10F2|nr:histidine kinase [Frateuria sp. Soil773]KRF02082.1 histidine kinase [Frateuria sp. Soil773]
MDNHIDLQHPPRWLAAYVAVWLIVVVLFAVLGYLSDRLDGEQVWQARDYLRWSTVQWTTLALLGPVAFRAAAYSPIEPPHRVRRFAFHLLASVGFALSAVVVGALVAVMVEPGAWFGDQLAQFITKHGEAGFLAYWLLLMVRQAEHFQREKSRRELQASQLQTQLAQSRLQVLKMQLHPHFLFNTLHAAATLVREEADAAEEMLLRLAELLRAYLDDDRQEISLRRELELVELYLGIQRMRFKDRLTVRVGAAVEALDCAVPSLILQPLVENAIQHGIGRHAGPDRVEIDCYRDGDSLCLEVRNRNSVVDAAMPFARGIGLSNTRLRLDELYGGAARIGLDARWPRGAVCRVRLPLRTIEEAAPAAAGRAA